MYALKEGGVAQKSVRKCVKLFKGEVVPQRTDIHLCNSQILITWEKPKLM